MDTKKKIINNIYDFSDENINLIFEMINNKKIISINQLNMFIDENATNKNNKNLLIEELNIKKIKIIKKEVDEECIKLVNNYLPENCKIKNPVIKNIEINNENNINELIELINNKFNIINKIL
jgi:hypothetical protein